MRLSEGAVVLDIDLEGGRIAELEVDGQQLLVGYDERPTRWGSFPMIPWCGRLDHGELSFGGAVHRLPLSSPPHAIHGLAHTRRWQQVDDSTIRVGLDGPWPYGGHATQRFDVGSDALTVTVEVHAADTPMPAMAGWHPWFRRQIARVGAEPSDEAVLFIDGGSVYELRDDAIPTGRLVEPPDPPWDLCFVGLGKDPVVEWPGRLRMTMSSTFDHWVVFTEPAQAFCVEPQSGPPNQPNSSPVVIAPGSPLIGSMTLSFE